MIVHNLLSLAANWIVGLAVLIFVGRVVSSRVLRLDVGEKSDALGVWVGLTVVLGFSYVLHIFVPLQSLIVKALLVSVLACAVGFNIRQVWRNRARFAFDARTTARIAPLALAGTVVFLVIARAVFADVSNYDSYLYHLQAIEYMSSERVVVGLANLHTRFGWHSSIFNVASLFENGTWQSDGFRLANGFIMTLAIIEWTRRFLRLITGPLAPGSIPILLGVPVLISIGLANPSYFVSSPNPDLCASLIAVVAFGYLIDFLFEPTKVHAAGSLVLCGLAMTFRPINSLLLASAAVLVVAFRRRGDLPVGAKTTFWLASPALLLVAAFSAHSTIVSGYPILPTPVPVSPFPWAVPPALIKNDLRWIESWAKKPGSSPDEVLGNWSWFSGWWTRTGGSYSVFFAVFTLSFAMLVLASRMGWVRVTKRSGIAVVIALVPVAVWFTAAPEPRLGFGQLAAASITPLFFIRLNEHADGSVPEPVVRWLIGGAALLAASLTMGATLSQASVFGPLDAAKVPIVIMPLSELKDVNGTTILTPSPTGDQCGRVKWCTPYLIPGLRIDHRLGWIVVDRTDPSTGEPSWSPARHLREGGAR